MKIAIVSDAWLPQINGVVTTLRKTVEVLRENGHRVLIVSPEGFKTVPLLTYPSIRLAVNARSGVTSALDRFVPDAIHIATEGPLGYAARRYCLQRQRRFTTSYHTQFPDYVRLRAPVPIAFTSALLRWFHAPAERTMVSTETQREVLRRRGFGHLVMWERGVDTALFRPRDKSFLCDRRPVFLYAGRVAVEKNIDAFMTIDVPGTKYVVGDGPDLERLKSEYPEVRFVGLKQGEELAQYMAAADVFVFPSRTDTFGIVMLEAMACGVPVAAYPVTGPIDVVQQGITGILSENLAGAAVVALQLDGHKARQYALQRTWERAAKQFFCNLAVNATVAEPAPTLTGNPAMVSG